MELYSLSGLKWVVDAELQEHRRWWHHGAVHSLITPKNNIPPFQFSRIPGGGDAVTSVTLISFDGVTTDITSALQSSGLEVATYDDYDLVIYPGNLAALTVPIGRHYMQMVIAGQTLTSEVFCFVEDVSCMVKIDYWHGEDFVHCSGRLRYQFPYKSVLYLPTDIGKPRYEYEEQVKKNEGYNMPVQQISWKLYRMNVVLPEFIIDALRLVRLHDFVEVLYRGQKFEVDEIVMGDADWQDQGDLAAVEIELKTDTVVVVNGRGITSTEYALEEGSFCVPITYNSFGTIVNPSPDYSAGTYRDENNQSQPIPVTKTVMVREGQLYRVKQHDGSGSYTQLSGIAGNVAVDFINDVYYVESAPGVFYLPGLVTVTPVSGNTNEAIGRGLPGATHYLFAVDENDVETQIGTYTSSQIDTGFQVEIPTGSRRLVLKMASPACGIFQERLYKLPLAPAEPTYDPAYANDAAAIVGGIGECELYRIEQGNEYGIISPAGRTLVYLDGAGCDSYESDSEAAANGVLLGDAYAASIDNIYGIPSGPGKVAVIRTDGGNVNSDFPGPFANDAFAEAAGVGVNEAYRIAANNDYGITSQGGRVLVVRIS